MKTIDTHAHLLNSSFENDINDVINKLNVENIILMNIGFNINSSIEIIELNKKHNNLIPVIGIHPSDSNDFEDLMLNKIESLINDNVKAIGEIGLDYYHKHNILKQKESFIKQIELAIKYKLPIVIHTRDSLNDCYQIIKNYPNQKFLLHSWSGDIDMTKKYLSISNNIYFSYNGIITFKNAKLQKEVIKEIPLNKLMFETDSPYLSPSPYRGKRNVPWRTKEIIKYCSNLLNLSFEELNNINNSNAIFYFNLNKDIFE